MLVLDDFGDFGGGLGNDPGPSLPAGSDPWFTVAFVGVGVLVVGGFVLVAVLAVRRARRLRAAGLDPLSTEGELMAHVLRGDLAPADSRSLERRLADLDDLARRGVITADERAAARRDLIAGG